MSKILGRILGIAQIKKDDFSEQINTTKQNISNNIAATKQKVVTIKENVSHPINTLTSRFEQGQQEALFMEAERKRIAAEFNSARNPSNTGKSPPQTTPIDNTKSNKKRDKKEDKILDKEEKAIDKSQKDDEAYMNYVRKGPAGDGGFKGSKFSYGGLTFLLWFAFAIYIYDIWVTNAIRPPGIEVILFYAIFIIIAMVMSKPFVNSDIGQLLIVILLSMGIPWVLKAFQSAIPYQWLVDIAGIFILSPPLIIFLLLKFPEHSGYRTIGKIIIIAIFIYGLIQILLSPTIQGATQDGVITIQNPGDVLNKFFGNAGKALTGISTSINKSFKMAIAQATGQKYEGQEEEQRGIFLDNFRAIEKNYYTSSEIFLSSKIYARNLVGEVTVRTECYTVNGKKRGETFPESISMRWDDENTIDCQMGNLPKGSHEIKMTASFQFETDADIQYYFVDSNTRQEMYAALKIPERAMATYTGGPVEVGLPSLNQPLRINERADYAFGVSLMNKWPQGKIVRGINYVLETPSGVTLNHCNRKIKASASLPEGRTQYTFSVDDAKAKETFDSVSCRMVFADKAKLFNNDLVAVRTFNARATYEYVLEQTLTLNIVDDGATN